MKLTKKVAGFALAVFTVTMVGCKQEVSKTSVETIVKKTVVDVTPTLSVEVNKDVSALAVRNVDQARTVLRNSARAGEDDFVLTAEDTLVALKDDGTTESFMKTKNTVTDDSTFEVVIQKKTIITYDDGSTKEKVEKTETKENITAKELRDGYADENGEMQDYEVSKSLAESGEIDEMLENEVENEPDIVMPAVLETYQCRYTDSIDEVARGVYIVYADASSDHKTSQLQYVYPNGEIFDIYNYDGQYCYDETNHGGLRKIDQNLKSGDSYGEDAIASGGGKEYLQFDKRGNAYIASYDYCGSDDTQKGSVIYKFNPSTKKVTKIMISSQTTDTRLQNGFTVDDEGLNVFTTEIECAKGDNAEDIWDGYSTINAYHLNDGFAPVKTELYRSSVKESSAGDLAYLNKKLYCVVNDYENERETGLYIATPDSGNNYKKENMVIQRNITYYTFFDKFLVPLYEKNKKWDYQAILDFIFDNYCVAGEKEFRLDRLYATKADYEDKGRGELYTDKTNLEAIKYLFEDGTDNAYILIRDAAKGVWDADGNGSQDLFHKFMCIVWDNGSRIPLEKMVFKKGTTETAFATSKEYYSTTFGGMNINGGKVVASGDGLFFLNEWNESENSYKYLELYQICDKDGTFIGEVPASVNPKTKALLIHPITNTNTKHYISKDPTTWSKSPLQATENGIVMMSQDKKTLYYYYNGVASNILINDTSAGVIDEILTFDATAKSVFYNAKAGTKYFTKKIDLSDFSVVEVKLDEQLGSIMEYHDSKFNTNNYGSKASFTVTLAANPVIEINTTKTSTEVTLKVTNYTEKAGYKVRWECMGNVLSGSDTLVMKKEDFAEGKYPITVVASKDGDVVSELLFVEITK